ncbi:hypothetical protein FB45DRAFT_1058306 [Roridomyces roridus]|uniref:F-box domain-containing protein n=1 Tax=Roridomyces roridus TaxID=1738132 RepID=A0AAD7BTI9_9AGAR|nr:hypothetical protein FB45DRAFT_1058306 [Roridomyces roridus]
MPWVAKPKGSAMTHDDTDKTPRAADRARITEIDAEIRALEERIRVLREERAPCQQRMDAHKYPVLSLANEVISEIFIHFLLPYPACPPLTGRESPTALTHICGNWRQIALATPKLWRAILLPFVDDEDERYVLRILTTCLERSGSCPISIQLEPDLRLSKKFLKPILLHRQRWDLWNWLSLKVDEGSNDRHPNATPADFPRLREVTLNHVRHWSWLPVSQLTSLTLEDISPTKYIPLLQSEVNLLCLRIVDCEGRKPIQGDVHLSRLETLVMVHSEPRDRHQPYYGDPVLQIFTVPALRTLQISGTIMSDNPTALLTSLITRSGCKLQRVFVTGWRNFPKNGFRGSFPDIPEVVFNMSYEWYERTEGDEEDSGDELDGEDEDDLLYARPRRQMMTGW